jgi:hypothetical protein
MVEGGQIFDDFTYLDESAHIGNVKGAIGKGLLTHM